MLISSSVPHQPDLTPPDPMLDGSQNFANDDEGRLLVTASSMAKESTHAYSPSEPGALRLTSC